MNTDRIAPNPPATDCTACGLGAITDGVCDICIPVLTVAPEPCAPSCVCGDCAKAGINGCAPPAEPRKAKTTKKARTPKSPTPEEHASTSSIMRACEAAWADIRQVHPDVPANVMFTLSSAGKRQSRLGHFWAGQWRTSEAPAESEEAAQAHEIWISAQHLANGPLQVMGTIVHEAAHAMNHARDVKDTDKTGRVHNKKFKAAAEELGLVVGERNKTRGFAFTTLEQETADRHWTPALKRLAESMNGWRSPEPKKPSKQRLLKATCGCGLVIRASAKVLNLGAVACNLCEEVFAVQE